MANDTINATTNDADAHTNNAAGPTSRKGRVDNDRTKVVTDKTINATTNNVDAHTNKVVETAATDSNALSMINTGTSDVIIKGTNDADVKKVTDTMPHINPGARYQSDINNASTMDVKDACEVVDIVHKCVLRTYPLVMVVRNKMQS